MAKNRGEFYEKIKYLRSRAEKLADRVGRWVFMAGILLASIAALIPKVNESGVFLTILFVLGLIVGYFNVTNKNMPSFLTGVIALIVIFSAGIQLNQTIHLGGVNIQSLFDKIFRNLIIFCGSAGLIVAERIIMASGSKPKVFRKLGIRK